MTEATATATGIFCWHELNTRDVPATAKFFGELCGWKTDKQDMGGSPYYLLTNGDSMFGGIMDINKDEFEGVPAHWMSYITCDDVDAYAAKVTELGGKICVPPMDIPTVGRFSVVTDPTGGTFSLFKGEGPTSPSCTIAWNELMTRDANAAREFYTKLFGWTVEEMPMEDGGTYTILKLDEKNSCGLFQMDGPKFENVPVHWSNYIGTENIDSDAAKIGDLGGTIYVPPTDIPNVGRFCTFADPTGAVISLFQSTQTCE